MEIKVKPAAIATNDKEESENDIFKFEKFLWIPKFLYKITGFNLIPEPGMSKWSKHLMLFILLVAMSSHLCTRLYMLKQFYEFISAGDIMNGLYVLNFIGYSNDSDNKFVAMIFNYKRAHHIYNTLERIYPKTMADQKRFNVRQFYLSRKVRWVIIMYFFISWSIIMHPFCLSVGEYIYDLFNSGYADARFPYYTVLRIQYAIDHRSPLSYTLISIMELLHCHVVTTTNMGADLYLICFTAQICMHLEYICKKMEEYEPQLSNEREDCEFLIGLMQRHKLMYSLVNELNSTFGISLTFSLISSTGVFCIIAAHVTVEGFSLGSVQFFLFIAAVMAQFYLVCYYGQKLITMSENVALTISSKHNWYNGSRAYRKLLLLMLLRSQKEAQLSAKGFHSISLQTFKMVLGMTYRVFALLQTMLK